MTLRPRRSPNLLNYVRIPDVASAAGVTERSVRAWLAKPKLDPDVKRRVERELGRAIPDADRPEFALFLEALKCERPDLAARLKSSRTKCLSFGIVHGGRGYISLRGAELYLKERGLPRAPHRPRHALTIRAALDVAGCSRWRLYRAVFAGEITAVIHSQTIYLNERSVTAFALARRSLRPLPGWVLVRDAASAAGRTYPSLREWLDRHGKPTRRFLHPTLGRMCLYMRAEDAAAYREVAMGTTSLSASSRHPSARSR